MRDEYNTPAKNWLRTDEQTNEREWIHRSLFHLRRGTNKDIKTHQREFIGPYRTMKKIKLKNELNGLNSLYNYEKLYFQKIKY